MRAQSHRHFTRVLDMLTFAAPKQKTPSILFPLDLMKKCLGNSDCRTCSTALATLPGKKQK